MRLLNVCFLMLINISLITHAAVAGNEGAAGGDGVLIDGQVYSLDLVEAGIEKNGFIDLNMEGTPSFPIIKNAVKHALRMLKDEELFHAVTLKISEIASVDNVLAWSLLDAMTAYSWRSIHPALIEVDDEDSVVDVSQLEVVQLAVRKLHTISINRDLIAKTDLVNRTALIFHEVVYALMRPELVLEAQEGHTQHRQFYRQSSARTRQIVAQLFIEPLTNIGAMTGLRNLMGNGILGLGPQTELYLPFGGSKQLFAGNIGDVLEFSPEISVQEFEGATMISYELSGEIGTSMCNRVKYFHPHIPSESFIRSRRLLMEFDSVEGKNGALIYRKFSAFQVNLFKAPFKSKSECSSKLSEAAISWNSYFARNKPF